MLSQADVFFLYPTSFLTKKGHNQWNADVNDTEINQKQMRRQFCIRLVYLMRLVKFMHHGIVKHIFLHFFGRYCFCRKSS